MQTDIYFPSKRDLWLGLIIWGMLISGFILAIFSRAPFALAIIIPVLFITGWIWFGTGYRIIGNRLKIYSGPFRWTIPLEEIREIRSTRNPLSSPACSLDRLKVIFGKSNQILISPADKGYFIKAIIERSPQVNLDEDLKRYV